MYFYNSSLSQSAVNYFLKMLSFHDFPVAGRFSALSGTLSLALTNYWSKHSHRQKPEMKTVVHCLSNDTSAALIGPR